MKSSIKSLLKFFRISFVLLTLLLFASCSKSKGGAGSPEGYDGMDEGAIPFGSRGQVMADINFAYDSSDLSMAARDILKKNANWMLSNSKAKVIIEGHCDERGTSEYNLALGERRARSAFDYLKTLGVPTTQLSIISYGKEVPLDPAKNEAAYARNRRAHFAVK